jgi:hypothetical protein
MSAPADTIHELPTQSGRTVLLRVLVFRRRRELQAWFEMETGNPVCKVGAWHCGISKKDGPTLSTVGVLRSTPAHIVAHEALHAAAFAEPRPNDFKWITRRDGRRYQPGENAATICEAVTRIVRREQARSARHHA